MEISQGRFEKPRRRGSESGDAEQRQSRMVVGELFDDLEPVEVGQLEVDQNHVDRRSAAGDPENAADTVGGLDHVADFGLESPADRPPDGAFVVDDQGRRALG